MNDENDEKDDWGMTMPHQRLDKEKDADDFSENFAPDNPYRPQSADEQGMTTPNFNLPNNQPPASDFDKTAPNVQIPEDIFSEEQSPSANQPPTDDWGMTTPNVNVSPTEKQTDWEINAPPANVQKQENWEMNAPPAANQPPPEKRDGWKMPEPVFRISEGENLDDVAKRTVAFNFADIEKLDKPATDYKLPENPPHQEFSQNAPNSNLPPEINAPIQASPIIEENKPPAKVKKSKTPYVVGGLFAMFLLAGVFLAGIYFLFFNKPTLLTAKKIEPVSEEKKETSASTMPAPALAPEVILPKEIEYKGAMVLVPAGEFTMGSDTDADDAKPAHQVDLSAFYIDKTEVTNAEYKKFCDATGKSYPLNPHLEKDYFTSRPNAPVVGVSFADAKAYADWARKRLPTEEEWEKAASWDAATQRKREFPWGNDFQKGNVAFGIPKISDVGKYPAGASPVGALDMAGNVLEWVDSFFQPYPNSPGSNAEFGEKNRVVRGGHFASKSSDSLKTTKRIYIPPDVASGENDEKLVAAIIGFRCAVSADDSRAADALRAQGK